MKIVMLGHTGVGKTSYMASLYEEMQQRVEGFHLKAGNPQDHPRLLELSKMIRSGTYPSATSHRDEYKFILRYQGKDVLEFVWADYKGGAIKEKKQSSDQAALLEKDLKEADGIMMFCDCSALARDDVRSVQIGRMTSLVSRAIQDLDHPFALSIILTKTDLISRFEEPLIKPLKGLIDAINVSEWVSGAFIPIACGIQSVNVPMPLLFTLHASVILQALVSVSQIEHYYNQSLAWKEKSQGVSGFFRWAGDVWNGSATDKQMSEYAIQKAAEEYKKYEIIKEPAETLAKYVDKLPAIRPEKNISNYLDELTRIKSGISVNKASTNSFYKTSSDPFDAFK
jgi:GTPase SAR1 family protein